MLSLMWTIARTAIFVVVVLALGSWIRWNGRTLSDQVKTQIAHAERSEVVGQVKDWSGDLIEDVRTGVNKKIGASILPGSAPSERKPRTYNKDQPSKEASASAPAEEIAPSERQKLRALIQELNRSAN